MEALPEALLLEQRASFMEDLSRQHLWAYLPQQFCFLWQFLRLQVRWSHDNTSFSSKKYRRAPCHQPDPVRLVTSCTWIGHANADRARFFQVHALVEHISPRSTTCLHKTELERKRTRSILQTSFFFERKNERERARERAPMTGKSSRARFGWPLFIAECNLPSQSSTELEQKS